MAALFKYFPFSQFSILPNLPDTTLEVYTAYIRHPFWEKTPSNSDPTDVIINCYFIE